VLKRENRRSHADFMQKVPKLAVFFGEATPTAQQPSSEQRGRKSRKMERKDKER